MSMVKHLPQSIKQLLTLRNPHPLPSPSLTQLRRVLTKTFLDARSRKAETGWLVLTACAILTANRPPAFGELYRFATRSDIQDIKSTRTTLFEAVNRAAIIRESALKSTIFVGVPRVILSLAALNEALDDDVRTALRKQSRRISTPDNIESTLARGQALWESIYTPHAQKLHDKLGSYHPDFISFIIESYGAVLSPLPGKEKAFADASSTDDLDQGNLSRALGSVVGIACLRAEERVAPQLTSHVFGLLKARYTENQSEEDAWLASDEGTEWVVRTVDVVLDGVRMDGQAKL
ncbi:hypothetical protein E1B28_004529 [Marasmius oreades]|uniref:Uncharacterized protein n=1 Tax=Marasmius oreades TaxID=181124 RepID=A0A9P8ACW9_9AGAR|nr:uncharacterized protein E1B28_004529 [Marasmius oreades]KAG7097151.1 hypothetical protein E1B28_004529 [Marasmius oreades]